LTWSPPQPRPATTIAADRVRDLRDALRSVRQGDFSIRLPEDEGLMGEIAQAFNSVVAQNAAWASELDRLSGQVLRDGDLTDRASLGPVSGLWSSQVEAVNTLVSSLALPSLEATRVLQAVADGDLTQVMPARMDGTPLEGDLRRVSDTINGMVVQLRRMTNEVNRVAREVGSEGRLGAQAELDVARGVWADLINNVNGLAGNLTSQVRNIAQVATAIANGDLSQTITVEAKGEILELKDTINTMVDRLTTFAGEVTRVARQVGTEGRLGAQADVKGVSGTWRDLTDSVNGLAGNLTSQVRNIAQVATAIANGDLSQTITVEAKGEILELKDTINTMVDRLTTFAGEVTRVAREVGNEGRLGAQAKVVGVSGTWRDLTDSVNGLAGNLTSQVRNIAQVATAIADGDLSQKITVEAKGEILALKDTLNTTVDRLRTFASEVTRVAREVGTEGRLGGQAEVGGVSGTWRDLTDSVNGLASNLTGQVRNIAQVATAIATGDLSQKITVEAQGEMLELKSTINTMVDQLQTFAAEVTRVAREVGSEGRLGAQAEVTGVSGTWRDLTDNVNRLAGNLTSQVRGIAQVTTAIADGDLSQKITVEAQGEILALKNTINTTVDRLQTFAGEVTRVAQEVGTEGRLGAQAEVTGVSGTWRDLTDSVNRLAGNLTSQVRNIAQVATAIADGDLSQKITVEAQGEILELKNTINIMVDQLQTFAGEVTRVAREVGNEGRLGAQADVKGVSGTWKDLTDSVNGLASNLTSQVRNIALVTTAIADGDLSQKITVEAKGEILGLKDTLNTTVDRLRTFAGEVTRVAREVGTEGKLGGQADVKGVTGTWKDLTDSVNVMASNLTSQVRGIARVVTAVAEGDLSQRLVLEASGEIASLASTINDMTDTLRTFADQVTAVAREVGTEGQLGGQARVPGAAGTWRGLTDNVNIMARNLTTQVRNIALVATAIANGDLTKKITVEAKGEILELKDTINAMVDRLTTFASEVTRVAREVGTDGRLGGQAQVPGVSGTWKDLTDSVNVMASNLTDQVRGIGTVVTAVARGDLNRKLTLVAKGEIASLAQTINEMTDTLRTFGDQVSSVAREVGLEGKLGGQAQVPGAAGTWRELTDNVNELAANLTTQVRAISEVATAVTEGDLSRTITVEASGEVGELKNTINKMIDNLASTTNTAREQDWLKSNLARFFGMLQGLRRLDALTQLIMTELTPVVSAQYGAFYVVGTSEGRPILTLISSYGYSKRKRLSNRFEVGEGLVGQCALEKKAILVTEVPQDYVTIESGLGSAPPRNIVVLPVLFEDAVRGVVELGSFHMFTPTQVSLLEQLMLNVGVVMNMISASTRTDELLDELKRSNVGLEEGKKDLEDKARQLEVKNQEIARASASLEEKARELSQVSTYKSQFLANMSHEIRTPLNSMLIMAQMLADNAEHNLNEKQVEYAQVIHSSGRDLLTLINEILDLSKVEAGRVEVSPAPVAVEEVRLFAERTFRPVAIQRNLGFNVEIAPGTPASLHTDQRLLQQILKNLLSNAFKFTDRGKVTMTISQAPTGRRFLNDALRQATSVLALAVSDTGVGIPSDKRSLIFEAFQQADATTARKYGGTGLGLTIARQYAHLLGGEIDLQSELNQGSTFTLYLPVGGPGSGVKSLATEATMPILSSLLPGATGLASQAEAPVGTSPPAIAAPAWPHPAPTGPPVDIANKLVLVVDDDARNLFATTAALESQKARVLIANSAAEALEVLNRNPTVDMVLMDVMMPDVDGYEATRRIHALPTFASLPVIAVTAKASMSDRNTALSSGMVDYLTKPVEIPELVDVIGRNLRR
jgi:HAMP domain-containing protein/signal transduction histidine kinase